MGNGIALDLASSIGTLCNLDQALMIHLRSNHYPPLPSYLIDTCKEVIQACNDEDYNREIELPGGITWRGRTSAPASACAEAWHLHAFMDPDPEF